MTGIGNLQTVFGGAAAAGTEETSANRAAGSQNLSSADAALTALAGKDQTVVSSTAGVLRQGLDVDDVRPDRVASLKAAIDSGTYHVSSADIADKLISSLQGGR